MRISVYACFLGLYFLVFSLIVYVILGAEFLVSVLQPGNVARSMLWVLPAYVANASPVVFSRLVRKRWRLHPMDFGLTFVDGQRLLGDNKTFEGFLGGMLSGVLVGILLAYARFVDGVSAFLLPLGALLGDLGGAFVKRRLRIKPGEPAILLDQLDFVAGALILQGLFSKLPAAEVVVAVVLLTPIVHLLTNMAAFVLGLKDVPW
ncbi:CDP-2,3-bis-(O-geranylgeranyl)-sn-glycerol synthase [Thermofilum pendens]|uniref:CDP-archaeol synthase n=1 Tax=Thermofilum pendens (strain DSM 2475 / Hrk 5) TaxID=368408 RepID=CDPAS_THEPD|nr:CDP-2,3-bis-(O-geranylgeranyl)-sn-glycerol synthase [Thermofilum pendens]A1RXB2.1 RecName: Full=CDP-archaeol synthase; AltName: Full=CDP-2,3-bis-(O-geranylgeranyl)-sn-glycerol synthase [Thermofilum pendens Hrk 5]ABL77842.1 protein of unknown function DUF46 [Thermofilum pendens Hrk 5]